MTPFFSTPERIAKLQSVAQSWIGTPFIDNGSEKQVGASCQKLVGEILRECGAHNVAVDSGPMSWSYAHTESLMQAFIIKKMPLLQEVKSKDALYYSVQPGDVVGFKVGGCVHHLGLMIDKLKFIHCGDKRGTILSRIDDPSFSQRLRRVWRMMV